MQWRMQLWRARWGRCTAPCTAAPTRRCCACCRCGAVQRGGFQPAFSLPPLPPHTHTSACRPACGLIVGLMLPPPPPGNFTEEDFSKKYSEKSGDSFISKNNSRRSNFFSRSFFIDYSRFEIIRKYINLKKKNNILEIGPGYPGLYPFFKKLNQKYYIDEKHKNSIKLFKKDGVTNIENYQISNFDLIICNNVIYYFVDIYSKLKKIKDSLNDKGLLFVDILNSKLLDDNYLKITDQASIYSKHSIEFILKSAGFDILYSKLSSVYPPNDNCYKKNLLNKILNKFGFVTQSQVKDILIESDEMLNTDIDCDDLKPSPYLRIVCQNIN